MSEQDLVAQAVGGLFIATGVLKFIRFDLFVSTVRDYRFFRTPWHSFAAGMVIVLAEALIGVGLVRSWQPWAGRAGLALLLGFTGIVAATLFRGEPPKSCGCFPVGRPRPAGWHVCIRNLALAALLLPNAVSFQVQATLYAASLLAIVSAVLYVVERSLHKSVEPQARS